MHPGAVTPHLKCRNSTPLKDGHIMNDITLSQAFARRRTCREFQERGISIESLHRLLWAAQGITSETGKRTAPSAHALHPLRLMVAAGNVEDLEPGVYSVSGDTSSLTQSVHQDVRARLEAAALDEQPWIGTAAGIISICADFVTPSQDFADQPPFGRRGPNYVFIEAGAAAQNIYLQAVAEGLGCVLVAGFKDEATAEILGIGRPLAPVINMCFGWPQVG